MNRYQELIHLCWAINPKRVLEIGTWNGDRAIQLCARGAEYVGFDLFEDATDETDYEEMNVKAHHNRKDVEEKLDKADVKHILIKGNTKETLARYNGRREPFEFVFIDGGHSVETIRSDWENVKRLTTKGSVVVFDDYYEGPIDTTKYGCNEVVKDLNHFLSQSADPVKGGGATRLAVVCR